MHKPLLIIKFGGTFPVLKENQGDFDDWTIKLAKLDSQDVIVRDAKTGDNLPEPQSMSGAIILGSHNNVTEQLPWSEKTAEWICQAYAADLPLLGICYGHQLIAHALGGVVDFNPHGMEIGVVEIRLTENASSNKLYESFPASFPAHVVHSQSVFTLPKNAVHLASSAMEANQSFYIHPNIWGVQYHPEFNETAIEFYLREFRDKIQEQHQDVDELLGAIQPTPTSTSVLQRFVSICRDKCRD